jgi:hypothetical protein
MNKLEQVQSLTTPMAALDQMARLEAQLRQLNPNQIALTLADDMAVQLNELAEALETLANAGAEQLGTMNANAAQAAQAARQSAEELAATAVALSRTGLEMKQYVARKSDWRRALAVHVGTVLLTLIFLNALPASATKFAKPNPQEMATAISQAWVQIYQQQQTSDPR